MKRIRIIGKIRSMNIYKILTIVLGVAFIVSLGFLIRNWYVADQADKQFQELANQVNQVKLPQQNDPLVPEPGNAVGTEAEASGGDDIDTENSEQGQQEASGPVIPQKNLDWDTIRMYNSDIYAWIYIPGTEVDYPVLQHPTDDTHYLNYNLNGSKGYPGCIYTELVNSKEFTDFDTIVYGHNMRDGSMFATLHYFESQSFFNNCPYIYIYTKTKTLVYEVIAAYTTDDKHIMYSYDFSTEAGRNMYLGSILQNGDEKGRRRDTEVTAYNYLLTLSTCIRGQSQNRFLVQAKLINEEALYALSDE